MTAMRAFVAIALPDEIQTALERVQSMLPVGRPVPADNMHLTLAFLDDQPESRLRDLHDELAEIALPAFDLVLDGLGCFGGAEPRALFANIRPCDALTRLRRAVLGGARKSAITLPRERFHPHVTLARFSGVLSSGGQGQLQGFLTAQAAFTLPPFTVSEFSLLESVLRPKGAQHIELATYPLNG